MAEEMNEQMPMADIDPIAERLRSIMTSSSRPLAPDLQRRLDATIRTAAARIHSEGAPAGGTRLGEAESNFRTLLNEIVREADEDNAVDLRLFMMERVMARICPLWPIC